MSSAPVAVRQAGSDDAALLATIGAELFAQTFAADNRPDDMRAYLATAFDTDAMRAELAEANVRAWIAESRDEPPVACGYAVLRLHAPHAQVSGEGAEVVRFYVDRAWHGRGIAGELMARCVDTARTAGARTLWLGVWERNARAIAFYARHGFVRVGEQGFRLGSDDQVDWVMARPLAPARDDGGPA